MEDETVKTLRKLNRERIHSIWEIAKNGNLDILTGEERRYAEVMLEHEEEYFNQFEMADLTYEHQYEPDTDENPFLHITFILHSTWWWRSNCRPESPLRSINSIIR